MGGRGEGPVSYLLFKTTIFIYIGSTLEFPRLGSPTPPACGWREMSLQRELRATAAPGLSPPSALDVKAVPPQAPRKVACPAGLITLAIPRLDQQSFSIRLISCLPSNLPLSVDLESFWGPKKRHSKAISP